jgi:hypothetical protein
MINKAKISLIKKNARINYVTIKTTTKIKPSGKVYNRQKFKKTFD